MMGIGEHVLAGTSALSELWMNDSRLKGFNVSKEQIIENFII